MELPSFLIALHAAVLESNAAPALAGTVAVGVRQDGGARWWSASFDGAVQARLDVERPAQPSAWLLLGTRSAEALVQGRPVRPSDVDVGGDLALLDRFLARYGASVRGWQTRGGR
ncbi:MAG: hypothetical protein A2138_24680 [Deltaproteobacteria bacterium RBG_16_71_12]|nr:MAG: hypothetical protein A2138_24680 [Deltaproteobacteria bacterium RBG_16_71_12]